VFLATVNPPRQLLCLSFIERVTAEELAQGRVEIRVLLGHLENGFRLLTDLSRLTTMDVDCAPEVGKIMELCEQAGMGMVIRVIPDPAKDIGLRILALFHYHHGPPTATCATMTEAARRLSPSPAGEGTNCRDAGETR
jgi:hypothetical protein